MKNLFHSVLILITIGIADAATINFDDLDPSTSTDIPNGYSGMFWRNFHVRDGTAAPLGSGYANGVRSPRNVAYGGVDGEGASTMSNERPFDLDSVFLTSATGENLRVRISGSLGGRSRYSRSVEVNPSSPTLVTLDFRGVDTLTFTPDFLFSDGGIFVLDNLSITWPLSDTGSIATVSEFQPELTWGGRAVAAAVNPANEEEALVASESGGLFRTTNRGASWTHVEGLPMWRLIDVAYAADGRTVIVTGHPDSHTEDQGGLWRSTDNGVHWEQPASWRLPCSGRGPAYGISFEPGTANVYVGTPCGLAVSSDAGQSWTYAAVANHAVYAVSAQAGGIVDIAGDTGHQRSKTRGASFSGITAGSRGVPWVHTVGHHPTNPDIVYAIFEVARPPVVPEGTAGARALFQGTHNAIEDIWTWQQVSPRDLYGAGRTPFVFAVPGRLGVHGSADIYLDTIARIARQTVGLLEAFPRLGGWESLGSPSHGDYNAMAFSPSTGLPMYLVDDGGVARAVPQTDSRLAGAVWEAVGNTARGFRALQLYDVAGQVTADGRLNLYAGTQDNGIWGSGDGGLVLPGGTGWASGGTEGGHFQMTRYERPGNTPILQFVDWGGGAYVNSRSHQLFAGKDCWNNVPPEQCANPTTNPLLIGPALWLQNHSLSSAVGNIVYISSSDSAVWQRVGVIPYALTQLSPGGPQVARVGQELTIYQGIVTGSGSVGLVKLTGIRADGTVQSLRVSRADIGLGGIASYSLGEESFAVPPVWGMDPNDPARLMAVDGSSGTVRFSTTGGEYWVTDWNLTDSVTGLDPSTGRRNLRMVTSTYFSPGAGAQIHVIQWDPERRGRIFVGTEAAGIFWSENDGRTWQKVSRSEQVTGVTAFFFERNSNRDRRADSVYVATYGRGLWKVRLPLQAPCPFQFCGLPDPWGTLDIRARDTSQIISWKQFLDPDYCEICQWFLVAEGQIRDLRLDEKGRLLAVVADKGRLVGSTADGARLSMADIPFIYDQKDGAFEGCPACADIIKQGGSIKGFVLEEGIVTYVIGGKGEFSAETALQEFDPPPAPLPETPEAEPPTGPYLQFARSDLPGQVFAAGSQVKVLGYNFSGKEGHPPLRIALDQEGLAADAPISADGSFEFNFQAPAALGLHLLSATQDFGQGDVRGGSISFLRPVMESLGFESEGVETFKVTLSGPSVVNTDKAVFAAVVQTDGEPIARISYSIDDGPGVELCSICGAQTVAFPIEVPMKDECVDRVIKVFATDDDGNIFPATGTVSRDSTAPVITCSQSLEVPSEGQKAVRVTFDPPVASDNCGGPVIAVCDPPSGSLFPVGVTQVTCTATDAAGNTGQCSFAVTVRPPTPSLATLTGTLDMLGETELSEPREFSLISASGGPAQKTYATTISATPSSGRFTISDLPPSTSVAPSEPYFVKARMHFDHAFTPAGSTESIVGTEYFTSPSKRITVNPGNNDLGDVFVINPGLLSGMFLLHGFSASMDKVEIRVYADASDQPDLGILGGSASITLNGRFDAGTGTYESLYEVAIGGLNSDPSDWEQKVSTVQFVCNGHDPDELYLRETVAIRELHPKPFTVTPGSRESKDVEISFGKVLLTLSSSQGRLFAPEVLNEGLGFYPAGADENSAQFAMYIEEAHGSPLDQASASKHAQMVLWLPEGKYSLSARAKSLAADGIVSDVTFGPFKDVEIRSGQATRLGSPSGDLTLKIQRAVMIEWASGVLQGAADVAGPYTDIPGATSPYFARANGPYRYYRVRN